jgi:AcrR family transcriptional regulator
MYSRARSAEAKRSRAEDLLGAARSLAAGLGGVRHLTLATVAESAGLHPSAIRRYFDSREDLLLELAERGWMQWREALTARVEGARNLTPAEIAEAVATTLIAQPLFCDLLIHVPLGLDGDVGLDRAFRYKSNAAAAHDAIINALTASGTMSAEAVRNLTTAALGLTAYLWQIGHPTPTLAELYALHPRLGHTAQEFEPVLIRLLQATATGLVTPR